MLLLDVLMNKKLHPIHWILKIFFHLLYHEMAWTYDIVAYLVSAGLWESWINQALPRVVGPRVLELGHGPGHMQIKMGKSGIQSFGIDRSRQMGSLARRNFRRFCKQNSLYHNGYAHYPRLIRGVSQKLPFPANSFESVLATFPTEYIFDPSTLQEIYRILIPGGRLVILFGAWITGRRWNERAAACLFRISGQAPEPNTTWSHPIENFGFQASVITQDLPSSQLVFIIGEKPRPEPTSPHVG
jgi:SAM-dependent methyltransferase